MQVPRFWRMKTQRYRLTGVRDENGQVEFINRPELPEQEESLQDKTTEQVVKQPAA